MAIARRMTIETRASRPVQRRPHLAGNTRDDAGELGLARANTLERPTGFVEAYKASPWVRLNRS